MDKKIQKLISGIPGWLSVPEAVFLAKTAKYTQKLTGEIVEIGSYCGRSTVCLAQGKGKVYAIDPHKGYIENDRKHKPTYENFKKSIKNADVSKKVIPIVKTSRDASKNWNKKIRFLFIDGLHDENNAQLDYELWNKYLVKNGVIAIHDSFLKWCGSEKVAVREIVNSSQFYKIGVVGSIIYGVKGERNFIDKLIKAFWKLYINILVHLNHVRLIVVDFPRVIKQKEAPYKIVL